MTLVAILTVRAVAIGKFRAFERKAAAVMAKHGGRIERTVVIAAKPGEDAMKEIHVVTFPNPDALSAYQNDPELKALADLRAQSVISTEVFIGEDGPDYHG